MNRKKVPAVGELNSHGPHFVMHWAMIGSEIMIIQSLSNQFHTVFKYRIVQVSYFCQTDLDKF